MKKLFIGLLIIAAGAGAYYFLQNKNTKTEKPVNKELLSGKWKLDSVSFTKDSVSSPSTTIAFRKDSSFRKYHYEFQEDGTLIQTLNDSVKTNTLYYGWGNRNALQIKALSKDSTAETYSINKLVPDSLVLQSKDSAVFVFTKLR